LVVTLKVTRKGASFNRNARQGWAKVPKEQTDWRSNTLQAFCAALATIAISTYTAERLFELWTGNGLRVLSGYQVSFRRYFYRVLPFLVNKISPK
jgi:hypothetical protein